MDFKDLEALLTDYSEKDKKMIREAYTCASLLHKGQYRQSGEEYIIHPLNVAIILAELHADRDTICAGLLHDVIEDTEATKKYIAYHFNEDIANLVDGVTKLAKMNFSTKEELNNANMRKIITSIREDVRIIIIKLADRLHNMRTLQYKSVYKQQENSLETMHLFVPLAYYIGAYRIKSELEDLSLQYLKPNEYCDTLTIQRELEKEKMPILLDMQNEIHNKLNEYNIENDIKIRLKNVYGIYKYLYEQHQKLTNIHDLFSLKIMVNESLDCYKSLGIIHSIYHPVPKRFKDYIAIPKTNLYQSLHTTVFGPNNLLVQNQIRTYEMDMIASFGLPSYFKIKNGNTRVIMQEELKNKFQFYKSLVDIDNKFSNNAEFIREVEKELFTEKVYVYTPKGEIIELPKGATVVDFAYRIHSEIGNTMIGAIVNDEPVKNDYILQDNDRVRILTSENAYIDKQELLKNAHTSYSRRRIRNIEMFQ